MADRTPTVFDTLEAGDRVLYNEKQEPLTVATVQENGVWVEGPQGGEYLLFRAPDDPETILESQSGNREYARAVTDLRVVGEWEQTGEGTWTHTMSGATVHLTTTDAGYWTLTIDGFSGETPDIPQYGYMSREIALEEAQGFMDEHPEG